MGTIRKPGGLCLRAVLTTLVVTLLAAMVLAETALAITKPATPRCKASKGTITLDKPTFEWTKARRARRYEVRVFNGSTRILRKTGIVGRSWTSSKILPEDVRLTWKVRARNAAGYGAWSKRVSFTITAPQVEEALLGNWAKIDSGIIFPFEWYDIYSLTFNADGTYTRWILASGDFISGLLTETGTHWDTTTSTLLTNRLETWEPAADDNSKIPAYTDQALPQAEYPYTLADEGTTLVITWDGSEHSYTKNE
jgi:hypothetical protein